MTGPSAASPEEAYAPPAAAVSRRPVSDVESSRANRQWWDAAAAAYQAEYGAFLRDDGFVWCPEGLDEAAVHLLGAVAGRRVLEVGCGAAQCSRWLVTEGADAVGVDLSWGQLTESAAADARTGVRVPVGQADVLHLPFADAAFDVVCSAYGALPFVADATAALREIARVTRPKGRVAWSVTHPIRWGFPDDPGPAGLTVRESYFDRRPYVEEAADGAATYAEHHRTLGDWVRAIRAAGLVLDNLVEPEWPTGHVRAWAQWSPLRGRLIPGTAIFVCRRA